MLVNPLPLRFKHPHSHFLSIFIVVYIMEWEHFDIRGMENPKGPHGDRPKTLVYILYKPEQVRSKINAFLWSRKIRESTAKGPAKG